MKKQVLSLTTGMLLSVLAADLLYLYYAGMWTEPRIWMQTHEILMLYIILVIGIVQSVIVTKDIKEQSKRK